MPMIHARSFHNFSYAPRSSRRLVARRSALGARRSVVFTASSGIKSQKRKIEARAKRKISVSRLNEAQQQYDKCVNMQIVNLFPPYTTFVITFSSWYLCLRCSHSTRRRFTAAAIWCRTQFWESTAEKRRRRRKLFRFTRKIEIKLKFTSENSCRYLIYEANLTKLHLGWMSFTLDSRNWIWRHLAIDWIKLREKGNSSNAQLVT
jgi:hypothetical protein